VSTYLPAELRQQLVEADDHRCAYCQTAQFNSGYPMVVDHIVPRRKGSSTAFQNLCFSCHRCNEYKGATTEVEDPLTGETVTLFHPRLHQWHDHFAWDAAGIRIEGLTAIGRVTVMTLKMNNEVIVSARQNWVSAGWHPPSQ
jgi:hypothetical protein